MIGTLRFSVWTLWWRRFSPKKTHSYPPGILQHPPTGARFAVKALHPPPATGTDKWSYGYGGTATKSNAGQFGASSLTSDSGDSLIPPGKASARISLSRQESGWCSWYCWLGVSSPHLTYKSRMVNYVLEIFRKVLSNRFANESATFTDRLPSKKWTAGTQK